MMAMLLLLLLLHRCVSNKGCCHYPMSLVAFVGWLGWLAHDVDRKKEKEVTLCFLLHFLPIFIIHLLCPCPVIETDAGARKGFKTFSTIVHLHWTFS